MGTCGILLSLPKLFLAAMALFGYFIVTERIKEYKECKKGFENFKKSLYDLPIALNWEGDIKEDWRVVTAANRHKETGLIIVGTRHFDKLMRAQIFALQGFDATKAAAGEWDGMSSSVDWKDLDQGFVDNYGDFLTREEAWYIADHNGQIINQELYGRVGYLYSENIH